MFIPVGHDVDGLRRWPIVTFAIIAISAVVFFAAPRGSGGDADLIAERFKEAAGYWVEHPELEAHPLLRRWVEHALDAEDPEVQEEVRARLDASDEPTPLQDVRQAQLDERTAAWLAALRDGPAGRHGVIPSEVVPVRYLTHLFVHGDFLHLAFNMLFLYLAAPLIEDVWGRPFFALFYLLAGVASAWLFVQQYPDLAIPLIGASGAVAGVLGAMLVRHPQTRIRLLWFWGFVVRRLTVPAWVVLPVWGAGELAWAWVMDVVAPGTGGGGVAHWVHVYGFVFGLVVAGTVEVLGLERVVGPREDGAADHAVLRRVERALARERRDDAWQLLTAHVVRAPGDHDAALVYWDLAKSLGRVREAAPILLRVIRAELRAGDEAAALEQWRDLHAAVPDLVVETELAARLASALGGVGHTPEAADLVRDTLGRVDVATSANALVELARAARFADAPVAAEAVARALAHPGVPPAVRRELAGETAVGARVDPGARWG